MEKSLSKIIGFLHPLLAQAHIQMGSGDFGDMAASMASTGSDYDSHYRNAGLYLGDTNDLGISDELSSLASNQDSVDRGLLAA